MIRRLIFVAVFLPFTLYAFGRWIVTGKDALETLDSLVRWVDE